MDSHKETFREMLNQFQIHLVSTLQKYESIFIF